MGTKRLSEYGSSVDTDDLADDSDLDITTRELTLGKSRKSRKSHDIIRDLIGHNIHEASYIILGIAVNVP